MLTKVLSCGSYGIDAFKVEIEVDCTGGLPAYSLVGLADMAVREGRERIFSAIRNSGYKLPPRKITINMAPADTQKVGTLFDLPIAIGMLVSLEHIPVSIKKEVMIIGELSLDGSIKKVKGVLAMAINARAAGIKELIVPNENAAEASVAQGLKIIPVATLKEAVGYLSEETEIEPYKINISSLFNKNEKHLLDMKDIKGQRHVKRALEVASAGGHNILMIGPPGSGKTMLARRLPSILPPLTLEEALEATKIHSVTGNLNSDTPLLTTRPFRSPHHTISPAALVGGGSSIPKPGEVSLSHHGLLFLDELPEFKKQVLEMLRQPLEDGKVNISRINCAISFPSSFMLAVAMNPCPCGHLTDKNRDCTCSGHDISRYMSKISGPLLDRIDIHIEVPALEHHELIKAPNSEASTPIRERVSSCRTLQLERYKNSKDVYCNAHMKPSHLQKHCKLDDACINLLKLSVKKLGLSARAYDRILKVSRTIADLEQRSIIQVSDISEAIQYRSLDRA